MKLTSEDKELLHSWGFKDKDFPQIEEATRKTKYELDGKRISRREVISLVDRRTYLSGIARSAFHWTALRETNDSKEILFDSSSMFQDLFN